MENEKNVMTRRVKSFLMAMIIALSMVSFAPLGSMVGLDSSILSIKASAYNSNSAVTNKLDSIKKQAGYTVGTREGNCYNFATKVTRILYDGKVSFSGFQPDSYRLKSKTNLSEKVIVGGKSTSNNDMIIALKNCYPGDIITYNSTVNKNGKKSPVHHIAVVYSVNSNGVTLYHGGILGYVRLNTISWSKLPNDDYIGSIADSGKGFAIYHYTGYESMFPTNAKPSTPTNLSCIRPNSTSLRVSWSAVSGATKYYVYSSTSKDGTYKQIGTTTSTTYTNSGLTTGKTYYYKVRAYNSKGYSYYSSAISNSCAPTTVANVKVKKSGKGIEISWQTYSDVSGYYIYKSVNGENFEKYATIKSKSTGKYVDNVACGKKYSYYIRAYKTVGKTNYLGWYSSTQSYTVPGFSSVTFTKGKTSATVSYKMINPNGEKLTKVGIRIKKSNSSSWQKVYTENITKNSIATMKNPYGSYKIGSGSEVNFTLAKGTTYYVQMFCVIGGTEYTKFTYFKTNS